MCFHHTQIRIQFREDVHVARFILLALRSLLLYEYAEHLLVQNLSSMEQRERKDVGFSQKAVILGRNNKNQGDKVRQWS